MLFGRFVGLLSLVIGGVFIGLTVSMAEDAGFFPGKLAVAGPALMGSGIGMLVFPGLPHTMDDINERRDSGGDPNEWAKGAPILHKIAWGAGGAIGFGLGLYFRSTLVG